ncbi:MAG: hypothetical protein QCI38_05880, partial [Candidatus Thermoplasmatota archaeon]|nr:hypothetical protein [Candidatus Thermoplasmatota archaeon]
MKDKAVAIFVVLAMILTSFAMIAPASADTPPPSYIVYGSVVDTVPNPVAGATVTITTPWGVYSATTDVNGNFMMNIEWDGVGTPDIEVYIDDGANNRGLWTVALTSPAGSPYNLGTFTIMQPTVDYILVTDAADGTELVTVQLPVGGTVTAFASGYNATYGGEYVSLVSADWSGLGGVWAPVTGTSSTYTAGLAAGTFTQTATAGAMSDTFDVEIQTPTVDYITITDAPDGIALGTVLLYPAGTVIAYASSYNTTAGYLGLVSADWSGLGGAWAPLTGTSSTYTADTGLGTFTQTATFGTFTDTFDVTIEYQRWYLHIGDLLTTDPITQAGPNAESLDVPDGTVDAMIGSWTSANFAEDRDVSGTWTFNVHLFEDNDVIEGSISARVYIGATWANNPAATQVIPDVANAAPGTEVQWTDTIVGTVPTGQAITVEFWFTSTAGGSAPGTVNIAASAEVIVEGTGGGNMANMAPGAAGTNAVTEAADVAGGGGDVDVFSTAEAANYVHPNTEAAPGVL